MEKAVRQELKSIKPIIPESMHSTFVTEGLADCVKCIQICEVENVTKVDDDDDDDQGLLNEVWYLTNNSCSGLIKNNL